MCYAVKEPLRVGKRVIWSVIARFDYQHQAEAYADRCGRRVRVVMDLGL